MTLLNPTLRQPERDDFVPALSATQPDNQLNLSDFSDFFQASQAISHQQKNSVYRLRHKVYCEELNFEPPRPSGLEQDEFDRRALHCSLADASSGEVAGTVRLIHCEQEPGPLPIEQYFAGRFTAPNLMPACFPRQQVCEISRLAVAAKFRRRIKDAAAKDLPALSSSSRPFNRYIAIGLYLMATAMCLEKGYYHGFVTIEPSLARILQRIGINFNQIGEAIDFNGKRAPYYLDARQVVTNLQPEYRELMQRLSSQLLTEPQEVASSRQLLSNTDLKWAIA
ncbi:PEP-CTERM/exosortase system-associated acyltransferase [Arsukibacterium indicum]|uniref:PEP-CTERM/exosortase system-associated acyltransferase n=1 Tax=Arsukibacterium indicum TaxID=2848612 RepID=A0ABS6MKW9_9GAMM|nr:PEP-CTERM/exosortase system-associated acyltransferase [Arsukibacterium indicum]MBV2129470.1 PEP-CTERM/exosortase system-associated acyltransferase [Arsukibacterium indicum]